MSLYFLDIMGYQDIYIYRPMMPKPSHIDKDWEPFKYQNFPIVYQLSKKMFIVGFYEGATVCVCNIHKQL